MSEFDGLWKHGNNQHALAPPKTEYGCPSGGGIKNGHIHYPSYGGMQKERKKDHFQNTSCKTVQPTHSKEDACGHLGLTSGDKLWGSKEEFQTTAQFIKNIHLQNLTWSYQHLKAEEEENFLVPMQCMGNLGSFPWGKVSSHSTAPPSFFFFCVQCFSVSTMRPTLLRQID